MDGSAAQFVTEQMLVALGLAVAALLSALSVRFRQRDHLVNGGYRRAARTTTLRPSVQRVAMTSQNGSSNGNNLTAGILELLERMSFKQDQQAERVETLNITMGDLKTQVTHQIEMHDLRLKQADRERSELRDGLLKMSMAVSKMEGYMSAIKDAK